MYKKICKSKEKKKLINNCSGICDIVANKAREVRMAK